MKKIALILILLPILALASIQLECKVFSGVWVSITKDAPIEPYECYGEKNSMAAFSKNLDEAWVLDTEKFYHCTFQAPKNNYQCVVANKDTVEIQPSHIVNTYFNLKKFLQ